MGIFRISFLLFCLWPLRCVSGADLYGTDSCHPFGQEGPQPYFQACAAAANGQTDAAKTAEAGKKNAADAEEKSKQASALAEQIAADRQRAQNALAAAKGDPERQAALAAQSYRPTGISNSLAKYVGQYVSTVGALSGQSGASFLKNLQQQQETLDTQAQQFNSDAAKAEQTAKELAKQSAKANLRGNQMGMAGGGGLSIRNSSATGSSESSLSSRMAGSLSKSDSKKQNSSSGRGSHDSSSGGTNSGSDNGSSQNVSGLGTGERAKLDNLMEPGSTPGNWSAFSNASIGSQLPGPNGKPLDLLVSGGFLAPQLGPLTPDQEISHLDQLLQAQSAGSSELNRSPAGATSTIFEMVSRQYRKRLPLLEAQIKQNYRE